MWGVHWGTQEDMGGHIGGCEGTQGDIGGHQRTLEDTGDIGVHKRAWGGHIGGHGDMGRT